ncbi:MAG: glutamyl-tRNA reductase [Bacillota bacterium]
MFILVVGLNHRSAPVEVREKLTFSREDLPEALNSLRHKPHVEGCAILSTCNRTEIYAAVTDADAGLASVKKFISESCDLPIRYFMDYLYNHTLYDAVRHLFRVAAGLDSMILGETQILGQVREAYQWACDQGTTNGVLNTLFQQAITVGKRVRTETEIDRSAVSISYAAVEMAKKSLGDLSGRIVMIVGAGKMSRLTASYLVSNGVSEVIVCNRSQSKAEEMAEEFAGTVVPFDNLYQAVEQAHIVISCTAASHPIIGLRNMAEVMGRRPEKSILMVDIAVPRDIEPEVAGIPGVMLFDIDDLQNVIDQNLEERKKAAVWAEAIIDGEIHSFFKWLSSLFVVPTIVALKEKGDKIKEDEVRRALNRLGSITPREKKIIGSMASSIVNQLLHDAIVNLKEYAANSHQGHLYAEILQNLFDLQVEGQRLKPKKLPEPATQLTVIEVEKHAKNKQQKHGGDT